MSWAITSRVIERCGTGWTVYKCDCCHIQFYSMDEHAKLCPCLDDDAPWDSPDWDGDIEVKDVSE